MLQRHYSLDVSAQLLRKEAFIEGRWVSAASTFPVLDPATGEEIAKVSDCGTKEAQDAVNAAYKAFHPWKSHTAKVICVKCTTGIHSSNTLDQIHYRNVRS